MKKISVCVPAYNRPEMMVQLINSFLSQEYEEKELVISDDSPNNSIRQVVESFNCQKIKYFKNEKNAGYCQNLLLSIQRASGDYLVVLGDDDLFLSKVALTRYVKIFESYPDVYYVYSNIAQFSNSLKIDYTTKYFIKDKLFLSGKDAIEKMWTTSIFIPGIGLRNNIDYASIYPKDDILFPQLEMVGHVLSRFNGFGVSENLIAGRAHDEQLGFLAIKGENTKGSERHGTVELFDIFNELKSQYSYNFDQSFLEDQLISRYTTMVLKEKMIVGNKRVKVNYDNFCKISNRARSSFKLKIFYFLALVLPSWSLKIVRLFFIKINQIKNRQELLKAKKELLLMIG